MEFGLYWYTSMVTLAWFVVNLFCEQTYIYMYRWHLQVWLTALPMLADSRLTIYIAGGELRGWSWLWINQLVYRFLSGSIYYCFPFTVNEWIFLIYVQTYQILIMLSFPILLIQCALTLVERVTGRASGLYKVPTPAVPKSSSWGPGLSWSNSKKIWPEKRKAKVVLPLSPRSCSYNDIVCATWQWMTILFAIRLKAVGNSP